MKKVLSFILALIIAVGIPVSVMADSQSCTCGTAPVVYVRGFGGSLYKINEDGTETDAFAFDGDKLTPFIGDIIAAVFAFFAGNANTFSTKAATVLDGILGDLSCTYGGESLYNIVPEESDSTDVDKHKNYMLDMDADDRRDAEYDFEYDWRLDPLVIADQLNTYIEDVKAVTGHDKVVIRAHSEGNCVMASYLYKYGTNSVEKICCMSAACNGINLVGQLFTKDISVENKGDHLLAFISPLMAGAENGELICALVGVLNDIGLLNAVCNFLERSIIDRMLPSLYENALVDMFATMPALWTFVPDAYYENAKKAMFGENKKYAALIERIDEYHYNVQNKLSGLLTDANKAGVEIMIFSQYGIAPIPVYKNSVTMGDMLVETKYTSFGATTAETGKTLTLDFSSPNAQYYSKDKLVDASTCLFPDYTWFVRGINHAEFPDAYLDLASWAILYDGQATVSSSEEHPQFLYFENQERLTPVTEEIPANNTNNFIRLIKALIDMAA